jgi:uncharacterized membrane protein (UPF0136 family)
MPWTIVLVFAYGLVTILLGVAGFVNKHSVASLISAGIFGGLVIVGGVLAMKQHPRIGYGLTLLVALAILGRFGMSFMKKGGDFYPDGVIIATSVVGLVAAIAGLAGKGS